MFKKLLIIITFLISFNSYSDICQFEAHHFENLTVQTGQFKMGDCFVSLFPRNNSGLVYRGFLVTSNGQLLVFNSFGTGPINTDTGARVFHTFPKKVPIELNLKSKTVEVTLVTGQVLVVDKFLGEPISLSEGIIDIDPVVKPANNGGVELIMNSSLVLDSGFRLGGSPISRLNKLSTFTDSEGDTCSVKNNEVFDVKDGEVYQVYDRPARLKSFLNKRCPQIDF